MSEPHPAKKLVADKRRVRDTLLGRACICPVCASVTYRDEGMCLRCERKR